MFHLLSQLKKKKHDLINFYEKFPLQTDKIQPAYSTELRGLEIKNENVHNIFKLLSGIQYPLMHLHVPKESYDEFREYLLVSLRKNTIQIQNISTDTYCEEFIRKCAPIRFSFRFDHYYFFFETNALGKIEQESNIYLIEKPSILFQERRSHQRYNLWPEFKAYLDEMQVLDISQKGISILSSEKIEEQNVFYNSILSLPPIYCSANTECYFEGAQIAIPEITISNYMKNRNGYRYGGNFTKEWPSEAIKSLNNFLLALRKKQREDLKNI